jgi:hypothetical protein
MLLAILLGLIGGLLGAVGGDDEGDIRYRRVGIPVLMCLVALIATKNLWVLTFGALSGALSMGYGVPRAWDAGSALGRFYYKLFPDNYTLINIFVRGTIGLMIVCSIISVSIINQNWLVTGIGALGIILSNAFISWQNWGSIKLIGKTLSRVDLVTWTLVVFFISLIILK